MRTVLAMTLATGTLLSGSVTAQEVPVKACVILTVYQGDTKNALKDISDQVDALIVGRNPLVSDDPSDPPAFEYYAFSPVLLLPDVTDEVVAGIWIAIDPTRVPKNVLVELTRQNEAYRQVSFDGGAPSRQYMLDQVLIHSRNDGCERYLHVRPGDLIPLTGSLLSLFSPYPS